MLKSTFPLDVNIVLQSLLPLIKEKVVSQLTKNKLARSSLTFHHLQIAFKRDPLQGIAHLFNEPTKLGQRISGSRKVINKVIKYFEKQSKGN